MAKSNLAGKMKLRPGHRAAVISAPDGFLDELSPLPAGVEMCHELRGKFDWVQIFVTNKADLEKAAPRAMHALKPEGLLWISFPKGSSKNQSDLTRDKGWDSLRNSEMKWINLISVNETWSAFSLRPYKEGEARQSFR